MKVGDKVRLKQDFVFYQDDEYLTVDYGMVGTVIDLYDFQIAVVRFAHGIRARVKEHRLEVIHEY